MKRIIFLYVSFCVFILACSKKTVPAGSSKKKQESGQAQNTQQVKSADGSENDVVPAKGKDDNTGNNTTTDPSNPAAGTNVIKKQHDEEMGKTVYQSKCIKCHGMKNVENYTFSQWESILKKMVPNAKLTAEEENYVVAYIRSGAKK